MARRNRPLRHIDQVAALDIPAKESAADEHPRLAAHGIGHDVRLRQPARAGRGRENHRVPPRYRLGATPLPRSS